MFRALKKNRPGPEAYAGYGAFLGAVITVGAAVLLAVLLIVLNAPDPGKTLGAFFLGPWSSPWFLGNTLDSIGLLLTASLGAALAFRGGCFNLGGEGQIYIGGLTAAVILLSKGGAGNAGMERAISFGILCLAALAAFTVGGILGAVSGFLKKWMGTSELITSFLLSAAISPGADYLISTSLREPSGNLLATARFAEGRTLLRIFPPSCLSLSFIFALGLTLLGYVFISRTTWGYRFGLAGSDPAFARYGGIRDEDYWVPALGISGALGGLTGFFAVAGTYGLCHLGFPGGLGWNAIAVALIARNRPLALFPAALIFGWLKAGSDAAILAEGLTLETSSFVQAAVLSLATVHFSSSFLLRLRKFRNRRRDGG
ncbi:MAG: ABC transporter permease [Spirochaetaceae bacterium]|jgi:simple sugar transport system permease protein|nr:ABC transporter permease [Spirochaetaceae bacterium]